MQQTASDVPNHIGSGRTDGRLVYAANQARCGYRGRVVQVVGAPRRCRSPVRLQPPLGRQPRSSLIATFPRKHGRAIALPRYRRIPHADRPLFATRGLESKAFSEREGGLQHKAHCDRRNACCARRAPLPSPPNWSGRCPRLPIYRTCTPFSRRVELSNAACRLGTGRYIRADKNSADSRFCRGRFGLRHSFCKGCLYPQLASQEMREMTASVCLEQVEGYLMQEDAAYALCSTRRALIVPAPIPGGVTLVHVLVPRCGTCLLLRTTQELRVSHPPKRLTLRLPSALRAEQYKVHVHAAPRTLSLKMRLPIQATKRSISREELRESIQALAFASQLAKKLIRCGRPDSRPPNTGPSDSENA
jgi:hypothetical protein